MVHGNTYDPCSGEYYYGFNSSISALSHVVSSAQLPGVTLFAAALMSEHSCTAVWDLCRWPELCTSNSSLWCSAICALLSVYLVNITNSKFLSFIYYLCFFIFHWIDIIQVLYIVKILFHLPIVSHKTCSYFRTTYVSHKNWTKRKICF